MTNAFTESVVEEAALAWLEAAGWKVAHGPDIAPPCLPAGRDMLTAERRDYGEVVLSARLRDVLLPKLISGELRVKDAERFLTRANA